MCNLSCGRVHLEVYLSLRDPFMLEEDFQIGLESYAASGKWRCTDIGTRVIVAIKLDQDDLRNYNGPPYSVAEYVIDESDFGGCSLDSNDFVH